VYIEHLIYSAALAVIFGMFFSRFKGTDPSWIIIAVAFVPYIDFSVHGNITSPNNPAFLNFTISNIQSGHLQIRVSNGTATQLNTTLTITSVAPTTGVYRPGVGFYLKMDNTGTWNPSTDVYLAWDNAASDRPIAGDWNADGRTETGVYRPGAGFYLKMDNTGTWNPSTDVYLAWDNAAGDRPIAGNFV